MATLEAEPPLCCSFPFTGGSHSCVQATFICRDCQPSRLAEALANDGQEGLEEKEDQAEQAQPTECCCEGCALTCHAGHDLVYVGYVSMYCDCGAKPESCDAVLRERSMKLARALLVGDGRGGRLGGGEDREERGGGGGGGGGDKDDKEQAARATFSRYPMGEDRVSKGVLARIDRSTRAFRLRGLPVAAMREGCKAVVKVSKDTFWLPCHKMGGRDGSAGGEVGTTLLERVAAGIFEYHTRGLKAGFDYDPRRSGAEFWTQVKDQQSSSIGGKGRGGGGGGGGGERQGYSTSSGGVDIHYDKDEELATAAGLAIFPDISTVTYLDGSAAAAALAPTLVFSATIADEVGDAIGSAVLSRPLPGKHLSFDGGCFVRWLPLDSN